MNSFPFSLNSTHTTSCKVAPTLKEKCSMPPCTICFCRTDCQEYRIHSTLHSHLQTHTVTRHRYSTCASKNSGIISTLPLLLDSSEEYMLRQGKSSFPHHSVLPDWKEVPSFLFVSLCLLWGWGAHGQKGLVYIEGLSALSQVTPLKKQIATLQYWYRILYQQENYKECFPVRKHPQLSKMLLVLPKPQISLPPYHFALQYRNAWLIPALHRLQSWKPSVSPVGVLLPLTHTSQAENFSSPVLH